METNSNAEYSLFKSVYQLNSQFDFKAEIHFQTANLDCYKTQIVWLFPEKIEIQGLNVEDYPIDLRTEYQSFKFDLHKGLIVEGEHKQRPNIGRYRVTILPQILWAKT